MVRELVVYPDERIHIACTDVRNFDEKLFTLIQDMKDTMKSNNLKALSAIQLGYPYNIIIIKDDENYKEYINPRILSREGEFQAVETSSYYPNITIEVPRYDKISIIYQSSDSKTHNQKIEDRKFSSIFQQMFDHLFGGTFLDKVSKEKRDAALQKLEQGGYANISGEVCPTFSRKDYFVSFTDKLLIVMFGLIVAKFFKYDYLNINNYLYPSIIALMIGFFFYAQYEAKKYRQCSSCQIGNNIGVIVKRVTLATVLFAVSHFI